VLPAAVLVLVMGATGFATAAVPAGEHRAPLRAGIALLALLVVLRACVVPFLRWVTTTLTVTDRRVSTRQGVLRSRTRDVSLWRVADVVVERTLAQRLIGSGTLLLDTTGERGGLVVRDVPGVTAVAAELNDLLDDLDDLDEGPLEDEGELDPDEAGPVDDER
jgi:uncharacterized membrane protein YdbT with pleckstrin-like domain